MKSKFKFYMTLGSAIILSVPVSLVANEIIRNIKNFGLNKTLGQIVFEELGSSEPEGSNRLVDKIFQVNDYERISKEVARLGQTKDLKGLIALENLINTSQFRENFGLYTELMIKICGGYNTYDFRDAKQYLMARKCAKNSLKRLDEMPIGRATNLVAQLGGDNEYLLGIVPESNWKSDRTERAVYWFRAWQLLDKAIIRDYNFESNRPIYHSKMTLDERNRAEEYNRQRFLQRDRKNYLIDFRRFILDAYSRPPYDTLELKNYLQKYVSDSDLRKEFLSGVEQRISMIRQK